MNPDEVIGQLYRQLQTEGAAHRNTIALLQALKEGEVSFDSVYIDANAGSWQVIPEDKTINEVDGGPKDESDGDDD